MKILVVEDDEELCKVISQVLREEGYGVDVAVRGDDGLFQAEQNIYDLIISDIMLPEVSGLEIVTRLRQVKNRVPVLLLTAKDSVEDRVRGLDSGADDYVIKPFAFPELLARVKALIRRKSMEQEEPLTYGPITVSPQFRDGFVGGQALSLTGKEYELLEFFLLNHEQILVREQIFDRIWGFESEATMGIVDLYVHYLRKKLAAFGCDSLIRTIRGIGFMLKE